VTGLFAKVHAAAEFLKRRGAAPRVLAILGTGLGGLSEALDARAEISYGDIPHFPVATAPGHTGRLVWGRHGDVPLMVMEGRFHLYEGYSMEDVTLPVRVARALGARTLLLTSAVGGMDPRMREGEIVVLEDHINLMGDSPLRGPNDDRLGPRFPDMSEPYDRALADAAEALAREQGFRLPRAILAAVPGPQLETRAEYRWLRAAGADVVGMSTVPECIAAVHGGMRVCALSVVTDLCLPDALHPVEVSKIIAVANAAAPRLAALLLGLLPHA